MCFFFCKQKQAYELRISDRSSDVCSSDLANFKPLYDEKLPLFDKIDTICKQIYGASGAVADKKVRDQLKQWESDGYGDFPVRMAKTQSSFSTDPTLSGAPEGPAVPIREVLLSAGAGFVVATCGARQSGVEGKRVSGRGDLGGGRH